jgi:hypothetical protein
LSPLPRMNTRRKVIDPFPGVLRSVIDKERLMDSKKYRRCCGIDVHKKNVTVCILPPIGKPEVEVRKRTFRTFTRDLKQLGTWLKNCKTAEVIILTAVPVATNRQSADMPTKAKRTASCFERIIPDGLGV